MIPVKESKVEFHNANCVFLSHKYMILLDKELLFQMSMIRASILNVKIFDTILRPRTRSVFATPIFLLLLVTGLSVSWNPWTDSIDHPGCIQVSIDTAISSWTA